MFNAKPALNNAGFALNTTLAQIFENWFSAQIGVVLGARVRPAVGVITSMFVVPCPLNFEVEQTS